MDQVELRNYRSGDWQAMYAMDVLCFELPFRFSPSAMRRFAEMPGAVTVLAEAGHKLAGFCIVQMEEGVGYLVGYVVTLDVAPDWRRRGLARRLMAEMESRFQQAGAVAMELHVFTGNAGAIRFYQANGYAQVGVAENFYAQGLGALVYRKKLPA